MSFLSDVASLLSTGSTRLTEGVTLFADALPDGNPASTTSPVAALISEGGFGADDTFGARGLPALDRPGFQVLVRSTAGVHGLPNPTNARTLAGEIFESLSTMADSTGAASSRYLRFEPLSAPFLLERDNSARVVYAFGVSAWRIASTGDA